MCDYNMIVVGGGPIGLSAAYECVKERGKKSLPDRIATWIRLSCLALCSTD